MKIIKTNGNNKDFYRICEGLDASLNENVPGRRDAGLNSLYNLESIKDVFLLYDGDKVIGSACLFCHDDAHCEVIRVFIENDYRGRGLVQKLFAKVERLARKKGYDTIYLRTWASTPYSLRAYNKMGYTGIQKKEYVYADKFPKALLLSNLRIYMKKQLA